MPKIKKIYKDIKSKQYIYGAVIITLMMLTTVFSVNVTETIVSADEELVFKPLDFDPQATKDQFTYYKEITLESDYVPSTLYAFPVCINISSDTDLRDETQNDGGDIAFFDASDNQLAHEIELFDSGTGQLVAWVNVTELNGTADTTIYMYYGNATIANQQNPAGTWNGSRYIAVWHMNGSSNAVTYDSLGTYHSQAPHNGTSVTGHIGKATKFSSASQQYKKFGDMTEPCDDSNTDVTFEFFGNTTNWNSIFMAKYTITAQRRYYIRIAENCMRSYLCDGNENYYFWTTDDTVHSNNTWAYMAYAFEADALYITHYYNGDLSADQTITEVDKEAVTVFSDGTANDVLGGIDKISFYCDMFCDEFRISRVNASADWLKTTNNSLFYAHDGEFFTLGPQQPDVTLASIKGLPHNRVSWSGTTGASVYCNDTGDDNEYLEINMTINATDNVTEIRVFMDDLNDTDAWINASNITMYVSSDNSSYGTLGAFSDGGSNISINTSTWNAGTMGTNPFTGAGLTDKNASIWCIFLLTIPSGLDTDVFWTSASNSCKIYIGYYE